MYHNIKKKLAYGRKIMIQKRTSTEKECCTSFPVRVKLRENKTDSFIIKNQHLSHWFVFLFYLNYKYV